MFDRIVQELTTKGYSYQQHILKPEHLLETAPLFERSFSPARVGKNQGPQRIEEIRGDWIYWLDPHDPLKEVSFPVSILTQLKTHLNQELYLGIKDFECHLAKYPKNSFYKKHSDRFERDSSRAVSFIFYLHQEWSHKDGGELILYNKQNEIIESILPMPGSLMVFLSEDFPHEVKICHKERRSLTGWMHTKLLT